MSFLSVTDDLLPRLGKTTGTVSALDLALLNIVGPEAEKAVQEFVGYDIEEATQTEYLPERDMLPAAEPLISRWDVAGGRAVALQGSGQARLTVTHLPLRSVTTLHENPDAQATAGGSWDASHLLTEGTDYAIDFCKPGICTNGVIYRRVGVWSTVRRSIKVVYVGGYTVAELAADGRFSVFRSSAAAAAIKTFLEFKANRAGAGGSGGPVQSESLDGWSITYAAAIEQLTGMQVELPAMVKQKLSGYVHPAKFMR